MLKNLNVSGQKIPVPIPLLTLNDALKWVNDTFVEQASLITSVRLNQREVIQDVERGDQNKTLDDHDDLEVQVDHPRELAVQILDVIKDLSFQHQKRLKELAVNCWQDVTQFHSFRELKAFQNDLLLIFDLTGQLNGLLERTHMEMGPINGIALLLKRTERHLGDKLARKESKDVSRLLLNRFEPFMRDLCDEAEKLKISIMLASKEQESGELEVGRT